MTLVYDTRRGSYAPRMGRRKNYIIRKANRVPYGREIPSGSRFRGIR